MASLRCILTLDLSLLNPDTLLIFPPSLQGQQGLRLDVCEDHIPLIKVMT